MDIVLRMLKFPDDYEAYEVLKTLEEVPQFERITILSLIVHNHFRVFSYLHHRGLIFYDATTIYTIFEHDRVEFLELFVDTHGFPNFPFLSRCIIGLFDNRVASATNCMLFLFTKGLDPLTPLYTMSLFEKIVNYTVLETKKYQMIEMALVFLKGGYRFVNSNPLDYVARNNGYGLLKLFFAFDVKSSVIPTDMHNFKIVKLVHIVYPFQRSPDIPDCPAASAYIKQPPPLVDICAQEIQFSQIRQKMRRKYSDECVAKNNYFN